MYTSAATSQPTSRSSTPLPTTTASGADLEEVELEEYLPDASDYMGPQFKKEAQEGFRILDEVAWKEDGWTLSTSGAFAKRGIKAYYGKHEGLTITKGVGKC